MSNENKVNQVEVVGLRELSNSVSSFIRKAQLGVRILVTDHGRAVAEVNKVGASTNSVNKQDINNPLLEKLVSSGEVKHVFDNKTVKFERGSPLVAQADLIKNILDESRGE